MATATRSQVAPGHGWRTLRRVPRDRVFPIGSCRLSTAGRGEVEVPAPGPLSGAIQPLNSLSFRFPGENPPHGFVARGPGISGTD